ncbi:8-demethyl-8-alpha-L-rhamnosyltetracenomycin-C 2'-O-methyltransferase [Actinokineospora baliensis]|nr:8-demethyl-8-alpha-L-rhamnosyltetracenomycin-C 2'-O-methyltransferase [Actinokineospora baliensis]
MATIDRIGSNTVAAIVLDELAFRARLHEVANLDRVHVALSFIHDDHEMKFDLATGGGDSDLPLVVVAQELWESVQALYGPREMISAATRTVRWPSQDAVRLEYRRDPALVGWYAPVQRILDVLDRRHTAGLDRLAVLCGTDKWSALHHYTQHYEHHLSPQRDQMLRILEIGVGGNREAHTGGNSLRMWKHYFPRAIIYGIDIFDKRGVDEARLATFRADQSHQDELIEVAQAIGQVDVIIDDGSHLSSHVIASFTTLFPYLRDGGLYFIEDLHASLWAPRFNGSGKDTDNPAHSMGFLKRLVDGLHHQEFLPGDGRSPAPTDRAVRAIHFYRNLAVIEKGANTDDSPIAEAIRRGDPPAIYQD